MPAVTPAARRTTAPLDPATLRTDFPVLGRKVGRHRLVYLDSAATSQKPHAVIDRLTNFYSREYAKVNETHTLSKRATEEFEAVRAKLARFVNAPDPKELVFLRGTSEALSQLGNAFADGILGRRDEEAGAARASFSFYNTRADADARARAVGAIAVGEA